MKASYLIKSWVQYFALTLCCLLLFSCANTSPQFKRDLPGTEVSADAININRATIGELQDLPFVGENTAKEIVRHREKFGNFRRPEHLILVKGISDKRFRKMRSMIKTE